MTTMREALVEELDKLLASINLQIEQANKNAEELGVEPAQLQYMDGKMVLPDLLSAKAICIRGMLEFGSPPEVHFHQNIETGHSEATLFKVAAGLRNAGASEDEITNYISAMQRQGVLFRERVPENPAPYFVRDEDPEVKSIVELKLRDKSLEQAVYECIGAASVCWEHMEGSGVFQDDRARDIAEQLLHRIREAGPIYE